MFLTGAEVPAEWTLQDRICAYLTLHTFKQRGAMPSDSLEL
jgi:hypothetical protein